MKQIVDRFLNWKLPSDFSPDCGISFDGRKDDEWNKNKTWPVGTNLLTHAQAEAMLRAIGVADLVAERDALKADADRYRWLRAFATPEFIGERTADELDAAIDAVGRKA